MHRLSVIAVFVILTTVLRSDGAAGMARHSRLYAVPTVKSVVIDGVLDEWDLSGQILVYVLQETSESQCARFAVMYDEEALYLSAVIRDPSPMMNRHDPLVDSRQGWDADACQFRMLLDASQGYPATDTKRTKRVNDQLVHMTLWYYTDRKEPTLQLHHGMKMQHAIPNPRYGLVPSDQFKGVYVKADDGLGYTMEYRIPWKTLNARTPPKGGDLVAGNVQFNWGRPDGMKTGGFSAWAYDVMNGPGHPFKDSRCWGRLIFSEKGDIPRDLVEEGAPAEKVLPLTFEYEMPEAGEVTLALFGQDGMLLRNILVQTGRPAGRQIEKWDGLDELGTPIPAGDYIWKGLYHQSIKTKHVLSVHNSGQPPYKLDNNRGGWGGDHGLPVSVCAVDDFVFMGWDSCEAGWGIIRTDLSGRKQWGNRYTANHMATDGKRIFFAGGHGFTVRLGIGMLAVDDGRPLNFGSGSPEIKAPPGGEGNANRVTGLAYADGALYASYEARNLIAVFETTGKFKTSWSVPNPGRLAMCPDGRLLVVSGDSILAISDGVISTLIGPQSGRVERRAIDHPTGITVDAAGLVYVGNRGELQCVSVFSPDGKYLKRIGKKRGRPWVGKYKSAGMLQPAGMAVDKDGRLWIAEELDSPKRISVWDTKKGKLSSEYFGGGKYATWVSMDPKHSDEVYCHNVIWNVDLDKGTWSPKSTTWRARLPNQVHEPGNWGYNGHPRMMTAKNGRRFVWGMWNYAHVLMMQDGDIFKPIVAAIRMNRKNRRSEGQYPLIMDNPAKFPDGAYVWQDANDDQTLQEDEILRVEYSARASRLINWVDDEMNLWCDSGHIVRPVRFKGKRPIYDFSKPEPSPFKSGHSNFTGLWLDSEGFVYTLFRPGGPPLAKWTRDGKLVWGMLDVPSWQTALSRPIMKAGQVWGPTMPLGVAGDYTGVATYFGPFHIFTKDGVCVAKVFRDIRSGGVGADVIGCEAFSGQLVKPDGMNRYFILAGDQDGRVTEVLGLDTVRRLAGGSFELTAAANQKAIAAVEDYRRKQSVAQKLIIGRGRNSLQSARPVLKTIDDQRGFEVRAAYDADNLYVQFDVRSPFDLVNSVGEPKVIFKGGNLLDIQLGTDAGANPKRKKPEAGDIRILVTRQKGKPHVVVYKPKIRGFTGEPIILKSPTGQEPFASIELSTRIGLQYRKKKGAFKAVVTVPLEVLGWHPEPGKSLRMDVGYIYGNKGGSQASLRAYWINNSFSANVVGDVPNESRLEPHEWGQALVE